MFGPIPVTTNTKSQQQKQNSFNVVDTRSPLASQPPGGAATTAASPTSPIGVVPRMIVSPTTTMNRFGSPPTSPPCTKQQQQQYASSPTKFREDISSGIHGTHRTQLCLVQHAMKEAQLHWLEDMKSQQEISYNDAALSLCMLATEAARYQREVRAAAAMRARKTFNSSNKKKQKAMMMVRAYHTPSSTATKFDLTVPQNLPLLLADIKTMMRMGEYQQQQQLKKQRQSSWSEEDEEEVGADAGGETSPPLEEEAAEDAAAGGDGEEGVGYSPAFVKAQIVKLGLF